MASTDRTTLALQAGGAMPLTSLSSTFADSLFQIQRAQLDVMLSWQTSMASIAQELWDEWTCRFAGGVPIDG